MNKKMGIFAILIAIIALGVGYAAISSVNLNVNNSTATIVPADDNFKVIFKEAATFTNTGDWTVNFTRTDDHNVTFTVTGFTKEGDSTVITLPFTNDSDTLRATLADATINNSNNEYFSVTATSLAGTTLEKKGQSGADGNLVITIQAIKTPVTDTVSTTITATVTATPAN